MMNKGLPTQFFLGKRSFNLGINFRFDWRKLRPVNIVHYSEHRVTTLELSELNRRFFTECESKLVFENSKEFLGSDNSSNLYDIDTFELDQPLQMQSYLKCNPFLLRTEDVFQLQQWAIENNREKLLDWHPSVLLIDQELEEVDVWINFWKNFDSKRSVSI